MQNNYYDKISDHEIINVEIETESSSKKTSPMKKVDIFKYDKAIFSRELCNNLQPDANVDIHQSAININIGFDKTIKNLTKSKILKENNNAKWFNRKLENMKSVKINLYQRAKYSQTEEAWSEYRELRNKYTVETKNDKFKYINNRINNAKDQKQMWNEIKSLVIKKPKNVIKSVIFNQVEYKDNLQIANKFNNYFVDSIKEIRDSIQKVQYVNNLTNKDKIFKFSAINILELKRIVKDLNNKPDFNQITKSMILDNWNTVGPILLSIVNRSLQYGEFPETWKVTKITPIEKILRTKHCEEFRPINSLNTFEKILEKVVKEQLEKYIEENDILSKYQSGFRKNFSCETTVNYVINRWKKLKKNKKIMAIFLDFKRAFETIDRDILIKKLFVYGIRGNELKWFKSYLTNRKQYTSVNNAESEQIYNNFGVPQGSILGALLFIIYINDMPDVIDKSEMVLYADDTLIFTEGDNDEQCRINMIHDIQKINTWLKINKLKLNENKTKIMEINMANDEIFEINGKNIEKVSHMKYLGFIIDSKMNFKEHVDYICKKIGKKIGFFKRIRNNISNMTAINIYNTIIQPHFEFGSTVIYTCCTESQIERLQKLQNKAMRAILKCNRYTPIQLMLDALKWLNIKQRLTLNTLKFVYKMKQGKAPEYLCQEIKYVGESQPYNLRNASDFRIQRAASTTTQRSLFFKGLKIFNNLPNNVKTETNFRIFKKECIICIRNNYLKDLYNNL